MKRLFVAETPQRVGEKVKVAGWVDSKREHGKLVFIDLRDMTGKIQAVIDANGEDFTKAKEIKEEWVIELEGRVKEREEKYWNLNDPLGKWEIEIEKINILSRAKPLPIPIDTAGYEINEEKRLKWRYIDLRRVRLRQNLIKRSEIAFFVRSFLKEQGFVEVETPLLTKSTPEGARDFLVPSRLYPGSFYALPQSPQQYKQLLQVAGIERYYQLPRCLRDEDPRADRQPEFTQIDIEMSFVEQEDILQLAENLMISLVKALFPDKKIAQVPFPRLEHKEVMEKYGTDRPDLREDPKDTKTLYFAWVVNFPMFEWKETEQRWDAMHHPFTRPQEEDPEKIKENPGKILAYQYDLVLNGFEIAGGSLRSFRPEILQAVFEVLGHKPEEVREKFSHLFEAFEYGVPPHGGIAFGFDRLVAILLEEPNIREVIAFPKTGDFRDLMMGTPSPVEENQLRELHIKIEKEETK